MLEIKNLKVSVEGKEILHDVNLTIKSGETHVLFGPNGAGKSTLLMTIMGFPKYRVTGGSIVFRDKDITNLPVDERARLGIGISFQRPPVIRGVKTHDIMAVCLGERKDDVITRLAAKADLADFLERDINYGFSGGEIKRSELMQLLAQRPEITLLDEPESGVDLENIILLGDVVNTLLERGVKHPRGIKEHAHLKKRIKSALVITHTGHILDYITADKGQVLYNGHLCCSRNAREILKWIREYGYEECVRCAI